MSGIMRRFLGTHSERDGQLDDAFSPPGPAAASSTPPATHQRLVEALLARIDSSPLPRDRRQALSELSEVPQYAQFLTPNSITSLYNALRRALDDPDIVKGSLEVLESATNPTYDAVSSQMRDSFLQELGDGRVFLQLLRSSDFWVRYFTVQILYRLHQFDPANVEKQMLAMNGVSALVDILNDGSNGGALRNEGLVLLTSLTATNSEIQTILAFENCFDSLFLIIREEGAVRGSIIVKDCLAVMQNILRHNKATQKLFREMNCATHLAGLLVGAFEVRPPAVVGEIVQAALQVITVLLRGADANGEGGITRSIVARSGILQNLCEVGLSLQLPHAATTDAFNAIALLLQSSKPAVEMLMAAKSRGSEGIERDAISSFLWLVLFEKDAARQNASMRILYTFLDVGGVEAAQHLVQGFAIQWQRGETFCGPLLGAALFPGISRRGASAYHAALLFDKCLSFSEVADQLLRVVATPTMTLLPFYVKSLIVPIQGRQTELATIAALARPLFSWLRASTKAAQILMMDEEAITFFSDWALQKRDPIHVQFLCAAVVVWIYMASPQVPQQPPPRVTRDRLLALLTDRIGLARIIELHSYISSTPEWQHAPLAAALAPHPVIYDSALTSIFDDIARLVRSLKDPKPSAPTAASLDLGEKQPSQAEMGEDAVSASPAAPTSSETSALRKTLAETQEALRRSESFCQTLQAQLRAETAKVSQLEAALNKAESSCKDQEVRLYEHQRSSAETTEALEYQLRSKDEELRHVVGSMTMMEERIRRSSNQLEAARSVSTEMEAVKMDREELLILVGELDEEREALRQFVNNSSGLSIPFEPGDASEPPSLLQ